MKNLIERYPATFGALTVATIVLVAYSVLMGVGEGVTRIIQIFVDEPLRQEGTPNIDLFVMSPMFGFLIVFFGSFSIYILVMIQACLKGIALNVAQKTASGCRSIGLWLAQRLDGGDVTDA